MRNISSIYFFYTPFLDLENNKHYLRNFHKKIEDFLKVYFPDNQKSSIKNQSTHIIEHFVEKKFKIQMEYVNTFGESYITPLIKIDIYFDVSMLESNQKIQQVVDFLSFFYECFDGGRERDFLIESDKSIFYTTGFFKKKIYPYHNFIEIEDIFLEKDIKIFQNNLSQFIEKNKQNPKLAKSRFHNPEFHSIYKNILYFIFIVYLMNKNMLQTQDNLNNEENIHVELARYRLEKILNLHQDFLQQYKQQLDLFFTILK